MYTHIESIRSCKNGRCGTEAPHRLFHSGSVEEPPRHIHIKLGPLQKVVESCMRTRPLCRLGIIDNSIIVVPPTGRRSVLSILSNPLTQRSLRLRSKSWENDEYKRNYTSSLCGNRDCVLPVASTSTPISAKKTLSSAFGFMAGVYIIFVHSGRSFLLLVKAPSNAFPIRACTIDERTRKK